jgi:galactonate dehydratase
MTTLSLRRRARLAGMVAAQAAAMPKPSAKLQIADVRLFSIREPASARSYSVVEVRTSGGLAGYGEGPAVAAAVFADVRRFWVGRAATSYVTAGPALALAGAVDMALLDIVGKASNAPVYRVLGGPTRNKVRAFASVQTPAGVEQAAAAGHRAFGVRLPGAAARNQGRAYQRDLEALLEQLRRGHGQDYDFVLEADSSLSPGDAGSAARTLERWHPLWFDEPCAVSNAQTLRKIAEETVVPLGFGRDISDHGVYLELLRQGLIDIVRPAVGREGITRIRRIAAMAEPYYTALAPRHSGGPIATAAALHLAATLPNFFIQQIPYSSAREDAAMRQELCGAELERITQGFAALPTGPGLGITVNAKALEKYHAA